MSIARKNSALPGRMIERTLGLGGVDGLQCLKDVAFRLAFATQPPQSHDLVPWNWKSAQEPGLAARAA